MVGPHRIVIVGGVAGGAGAAAKARRVNESAEIFLFERGPYVSFANCGLPYYVGGQIEKRDSLLLQTPETFWNRFQVKVHVRHEALSIDRVNKRVLVKNLNSGETFQQPYDRLILAPGAGAIVPPLPGIDGENIFTVKTVPDGDAIKSFIHSKNPRRAVVVGGGFIGLESADVLKKLGLHVTLVELLPQVLPPFDSDMARFISDHLVGEGVDVVLGDGLKGFHGGPTVTEVELASGRRIGTDFVILSLGVRPEIQLAKKAGLAIGSTGGIEVNDRQQTSDPDIFAAGDAVETVQLITGTKTRIPLAGPANKQGRVAGANAAGGDLRFPGALGTAIVDVLGLTAAKTGLSEKEAQQAKLSYYTSYTHGQHHAGYYPGSEMMHMKLIVENGSGRLLGAQIVGEHGVDKRIDILATALSFRKTVQDLENLDLAYAPQFSSAKDPVIMAGFVAANVARGEIQTVSCADLEKRIKEGTAPQIVDVRTPAEHAKGAFPQAKLIPIDDLRHRIGELDPAQETVVFCRIGLRGYLAARILQSHGFKRVFNLSGGVLSCPPPADRSLKAKGAVSWGDRVSAMDVKNEYDKGAVHLIDVRDSGDYSYENIKGSVSVPINHFPPVLPNDGRPRVLVCQTGMRSLESIVAARAAGWSQVHSLEGGLNAWKKAGFPTVRGGGPIPIMRQVQIVAGSMALVGGLFVPLRWVAIFVGAGLIFAGATGTCAMATMLSKMP